ncbi:MAG: ATP-binding protein [Planctomycetota bacterium]|nr:ATP-binding protein [Planctomycetota bacterium]
MSLVKEALLAGIQERLGSQLPESLYTQWFVQMEILSWDEGRLEIGVPNRFFKERIEMAYFSQLQAAAAAVAGYPVKVDVSVSPRLFVAFRKARELDLAEAANLAAKDGLLASGLPGTAAPTVPSRRVGLALNPGFLFDNFVVGASNRLSHAVALRAAERPGEYSRIYLCGQPGIGKTHLLQAICHAARRLRPETTAIYTTGERFVAEFGAAFESGRLKEFRQAYHHADLLAFDDLQVLGVGKKTASQAELLRIIDDFAARGGQIAFASLLVPDELEGIDGKLRDRLGAGFVDRLLLPDEETRRELIARKMRERCIELPPAAIKTLAAGISGNVWKLEGTVSRLAAMIHIEGREPTPACIRAALEVSIPPTRKSALTFQDVMTAAAEECGVTLEALSGRGRSFALKRARQIAIVLCRQLIGGSYAELGQAFGGRSHATLIAVMKNVPRELFSSGLDSRPVERILFRLGLNLKPEDVLEGQKKLLVPPAT